jgi:hypothetical protein
LACGLFLQHLLGRFGGCYARRERLHLLTARARLERAGLLLGNLRLAFARQAHAALERIVDARQHRTRLDHVALLHQ